MPYIFSVVVEPAQSNKPTPAEAPGNNRKMKLKKELKKAGAKTSDDVDFEDLFGRDPDPVCTDKLYCCSLLLDHTLHVLSIIFSLKQHSSFVKTHH